MAFIRALPPRPAWPLLCVAIAISASFGWWFATQQIALLDREALHPPLRLMLNTSIRVALVSLIFYIWCSAYVTARDPVPFAAWQPLMGLLPLMTVFVGITLPWALRLSLLVFLGTCLITFFNRRARSPHHASDRHLIALGIIFLTHLLFNTHFSLLSFRFNSFGWPEGYDFENAASSRLFQSFIWIKQFSLSSLNYSFWLISPLSCINYESFLLRALALLLNSPSMDVSAFHNALHALIFILFLGGAFGFYLLLNVGLRLRWSLSAAGGILYIFLDPFFGTLGLFDRVNSLAVLTVFPYGVCLMLSAFRTNKIFPSLLAGAALASSFFLLAPHPESAFQMLLCFGILALALAYGAPEATPLKDRVLLLVLCGLSFTVLSAFYVMPQLLQQLRGEIVIRGHASEFPGVSLWRLIRLDVPVMGILYFFIAIKCFGILRRRLKGRKMALPVATLALTLLLLPMHSPLLFSVNALLHMDEPNLDNYARRGYFITFCTLILVFYAMDQSAQYKSILDRIKRGIAPRVNYSRPARMFVLAWAVALCLPLQPRPDLPSNAKHCDYYVMLASLLANYPLLKGDDANTQLIRDRLSNFERDLKTRKATEYAQQYDQLLKKFSISTADTIKEAPSLYAFALSTAPLVDKFYMDSSFSCVHPLEGKNLAGARFIRPNIASLYSGLPASFLRIGDFTANDTLPDMANATGLLSFGVGPGLFLHNSTMDFNPRYMVSVPLLHALYICPGFDFLPLGNLNRNDCGFRPRTATLLNPLYRKVLNIAGLDVILAQHQLTEKLAEVEGLKEIVPDNPPSLPDRNAFVLLRNQQSYGMAYLADHVEYISPSLIKPLEPILRRHLIRHDPPEAFNRARDFLYAQLNSLHGYRDILLEDKVQDGGKDVPAGDITIRNILGEATVMKADCRRQHCVLVYNLAAIPGWHAYADGVPLSIMRANFAFMAVSLPKGTHEVWFVYAPYSGLFFTVLSLLGFCLLAYQYRK